MPIHNKLAEKAFLSGRTSEQFRAAAQKNANASWLFLIIAAAVWYFAGWKWALIPGFLVGLSVVQSISATMIAERLSRVEKVERKPQQAG